MFDKNFGQFIVSYLDNIHIKIGKEWGERPGRNFVLEAAEYFLTKWPFNENKTIQGVFVKNIFVIAIKMVHKIQCVVVIFKIWLGWFSLV